MVMKIYVLASLMTFAELGDIKGVALISLLSFGMSTIGPC